MSYASLIQSLPQKLTQPTGIAVMASVGIHALAGLALPFFANSSPEKPQSPQTVELVELTPTELSRVPELSPPPLPPSAFAPTPLTSAFPPLDRAKPPSSTPLNTGRLSGGRSSSVNIDLLRQQLAQQTKTKRPSMPIQDAPVRIQQRQRSQVTPRQIFQEADKRSLRTHSAVRLPRTSVGDTLVGIKPNTNFPALDGNTATNPPRNNNTLTNLPNLPNLPNPPNLPANNNTPTNQPPANNPSSSQPPANNPSPNQPPANNPSSSQPPANNPSSSQPPANNPNSNQSQASNSPTNSQERSTNDNGTGASRQEQLARLIDQGSEAEKMERVRDISIECPSGVECSNLEAQVISVFVTVNSEGKIVSNEVQGRYNPQLVEEVKRAAASAIPKTGVNQRTFYPFRVRVNPSQEPSPSSSSSSEG